MLPFRTLFEMLRPRQDRIFQRKVGHAAVAAGLDHELRGWRSRTFIRGNKGEKAVGGRGSRRRGSRRQSWLLHIEVLLASALSARRFDSVVTPGVQVTVGQSCIKLEADDFRKHLTALH